MFNKCISNKHWSFYQRCYQTRSAIHQFPWCMCVEALHPERPWASSCGQTGQVCSQTIVKNALILFSYNLFQTMQTKLLNFFDKHSISFLLLPNIAKCFVEIIIILYLLFVIVWYCLILFTIVRLQIIILKVHERYFWN